jgi:ferredoxin
VLQSTLAQPRHLIAGIEKMALRTGPAVALVAEPSWQAPVDPWLQLIASHQARVTPCFRYDPGSGETWAERFDLDENPQPDASWPRYAVAFFGRDGEPDELSEPFTFAHAAAIDPAYRAHFRILPPEAWADDQIEIGRFLDESADGRRGGLPFLWVVDRQGRLARAAMTREMSFACRDRMRGWRVLQELGGYGNEYARRAARRATEEARAETEARLAEQEARHAEALEKVRAEAAGQAMERLVAVLMDLDSAPAPAISRPAPAGPQAPTAEPAPAPVEEQPSAEAEAAEPEEEEELALGDPYIDSVLCTTCNECINLNPRLFVYNENRQATIADVAAGTFEELVKAAEKCPARCIHPGAPRPDDATANDELIARAKAFN